MDLLIRIRVIYNNVKHPYVIDLKFGDKLNFSNQVMLEAKATICYAIKENLLLSCRKLLLLS